jgi:hypothetical protein
LIIHDIFHPALVSLRILITSSLSSPAKEVTIKDHQDQKGIQNFRLISPECISDKTCSCREGELAPKRGTSYLAEVLLSWRQEQDAAAGGKQCLLVVVGEPCPHQAVEMARQQPQRFGFLEHTIQSIYIQA